MAKISKTLGLEPEVVKMIEDEAKELDRSESWCVNTRLKESYEGEKQ